MRTTNRIFLSVFLGLMSACVNTGPTKNVAFRNIERLSDLDGVYMNLGESGSKVTSEYLTKIIWPSMDDEFHSSIDRVSVKAGEALGLTVTALQDQTTVKEQTFIEGEDFTFDAGRLHLANRVEGASEDGGGGLMYKDIDIGLDVAGDAKYREDVFFAGVVLLVPIAAGGYSDIRFSKLSP